MQDVYLCSGQSNMVFPVGPGNDYPIEDGGQSMANATAVILAANHPDMRERQKRSDLSPRCRLTVAGIRDVGAPHRHATAPHAQRSERLQWLADPRR